MPQVTIAGMVYTVAHLEGAAYHRYVFYIAERAREMNPWLDLYRQVQTLPANLQEIAFWRLYHEPLNAVSEADAYRIGSQVDAVKLLVKLMIEDDWPAVEAVTEENAADIFAELYPHIEKGEEREVSGQEAAGIMREQMKREVAINGIRPPEEGPDNADK